MFGSFCDNVLLLGDAAHSIVPTIGQGATLAIEDACVASEILINDIQSKTLGRNTIEHFEEERRKRRAFVSDVSLEESFHLMNQPEKNEIRLQKQKNLWRSERAGFRQKLRKVWRGGPVIYKNFQISESAR